MFIPIASCFLFFASLVKCDEPLKNLVVIRQDTNRVGFFDKISMPSGNVTKEANTKFAFDWPLVEMTSDSNTGEIYTVTYPDGYPGPVLYRMDSDLNLLYSWEHTDYSFFDLQYSPRQDAMYGILVTSSYGRALSNFTLDQENDSITTSELYTLPYMWYVNASTFDADNSRYFALINNFPGFDNSTLDQQLIVADFSQDAATTAPKVDLLPVHTRSSLYNYLAVFLSYSSATKTLYSAGLTGNVAQLVIMGQQTGLVDAVLFSYPGATYVGPLMVVTAASTSSSSTDTDTVSLYVQKTFSPEPEWEQWLLTITYPTTAQGQGQGSAPKVTAEVIQRFQGNDYAFFSGATAIAK
jgi:hypothetical protein